MHISPSPALTNKIESVSARLVSLRQIKWSEVDNLLNRVSFSDCFPEAKPWMFPKSTDILSSYFSDAKILLLVTWSSLYNGGSGGAFFSLGTSWLYGLGLAIGIFRRAGSGYTATQG